MDQKPSVLFISCTTESPDNIVKLVLNQEVATNANAEEDVKTYPWHIDNKYYEADIHLIALRKKILIQEELADFVEGVVILFDSTCKDGLALVESWLPFIQIFSPDVKILLCENCQESINEVDGISKCKAQKWCIANGFELVEIKPIVDDIEDDVEDDFPETTGIKRITQALHAHVWPNLVLKTTSGQVSLPSTIMQESTAVQDSDNIENTEHAGTGSLLEASLEELLENDGGFSDLFSQLHEMKSRVASLSGDERKAAAEQVVKAFWRAMGGDEEELEDSDS